MHQNEPVLKLIDIKGGSISATELILVMKIVVFFFFFFFFFFTVGVVISHLARNRIGFV